MEKSVNGNKKGKKGYKELINSIDSKTREKWEKIQNEIREKLTEEDEINKEIKYVAGMDITFSQENKDVAIATIYVFDEKIKPIFTLSKIVLVEVEYIPSFLAFREIEPMLEIFRKTNEVMKEKYADFKIDLIFIDGNGILHPRFCGLATHLGVLVDTPTIGCAKTIFSIDGINKETVLKKIKEKFKKMDTTGFEYLKGKSGKIWGAAVKNSINAFVPLIVSIGHKINIDSAIDLVFKYSICRVVEPIRYADKQSRFLIDKFDKFILTKDSALDLKFIIQEFQTIIDLKYNKPKKLK